MNIKPKFLEERLCSIEDALAQQEKLFALKANIKNPEECNFLLFAEHEPVYTCKPYEKKQIEAGNITRLLKPKIRELPAPLFAPDDRTGSITYHGPGQLVCYMIVCLEEVNIPYLSLDINSVIDVAIKEFLLEFGVKGYLLPELLMMEDRSLHDQLIQQGAMRRVKDDKKVIDRSAVGVWAVTKDGIPKKIVSRGVQIKSIRMNDDIPSRHITKMGFALNINTDLSCFNHIYPCGLNLYLTSIKECKGSVAHSVLGENPPMHRIAEVLANLLIKNFKLRASINTEEI